MATSFFNDKNRNIVGDLVELLVETNQEVPRFLEDMQSNDRFGGPRRTGGGGGGGGGRNNSNRYGGNGFGSRDYRQGQSGGGNKGSNRNNNSGSRGSGGGYGTCF